MVRTLHEQHEFSDRFIAHMLARNIRIEEDLVDQLFNSSAKRLARTLLLLARYGKEDTTDRTVPHRSIVLWTQRLIGHDHSTLTGGRKGPAQGRASFLSPDREATWRSSPPSWAAAPCQRRE